MNGPAWYPRAKVRPLGWVEVNGRRMRAVYVPPGVGFHNIRAIHQTLLLDEELARHVKLVGP